jgi:methionyl-tRNA synthetase
MAAPWKLAKDPARAEALDHVLFALVEALRIIAILISPVLPNAAREILYQLNLKNEYTLANATWGALPEKHQLGKPTPLFPRIES